jgi:glucose-6-phosphate 1-dehydrogenase
VRGQFRGYLKEPGVSADSTTETFAALRLQVDSWRWDGVPFFIRAGKCLPTTKAEVIVQLRRPPLTRLGPRDDNTIRLRPSPGFSISIGTQVKRRGEQLTSETIELDVVRHPDGGEQLPYERLLGDAMKGDPMLFAREDGVEAAWAIVEPVLGDETPPHPYEAGAWGPADAARLTERIGGWRESA